MESGENGAIGLSVRQAVENVPKKGPEYATIQHLNTREKNAQPTAQVPLNLKLFLLHHALVCKCFSSTAKLYIMLLKHQTTFKS